MSEPHPIHSVLPVSFLLPKPEPISIKLLLLRPDCCGIMTSGMLQQTKKVAECVDQASARLDQLEARPPPRPPPPPPPWSLGLQHAPPPLPRLPPGWLDLNVLGSRAISALICVWWRAAQWAQRAPWPPGYLRWDPWTPSAAPGHVFVPSC